jgi:hypothetical protein
LPAKHNAANSACRIIYAYVYGKGRISPLSRFAFLGGRL